MDDLRQILEANGGDLSKAANHLGIEAVSQPPITYTPRRRIPPVGTGVKEGWPAAKHIASIRHCDAAWPPQEATQVEKARAGYEAGTHEMVTARHGDWFVLFSVPRRVRCAPRKFFSELS